MDEIPGTVQLLAYAVAMLLGFGGKSGVDRFRARRNGNGGLSRDAVHIVGAIQDEGTKTRAVMAQCTGVIQELRVEVAQKGK